MLTTSERPSSSSKDTEAAPDSAARSGVSVRLQASTSIPNAAPTSATLPPIRPRPSTPRVDPARSRPTVDCHPPARRRVDLVDQMAAVSQDQRPGELDRRRRDAVGVADHDPPPVRGRHVDHRVATAGRHDQPQPIEAVDHRGREGRPLAHQHDRLVPRQPLRQRVGVDHVIGEDVDPPLGLQPGPVRQLQGDPGVVIEHRNVHPRHYAPWLRQLPDARSAELVRRLPAQ